MDLFGSTRNSLLGNYGNKNILAEFHVTAF